jgi:hypothetical protein
MLNGSGVTQRTASILIEADEAAHAALSSPQTNLHNLAYRRLRNETPLGAQMCRNALRTVTAAHKARRSNGRFKKDLPPTITFRSTSRHFDSRTFAMRGNELSLYTLTGRVAVTLKPGEIGLRAKHRFDCKCGRRAHGDVNAASNLARLGESALSPRADVNRTHVAEIGHPSLGQ